PAPLLSCHRRSCLAGRPEVPERLCRRVIRPAPERVLALDLEQCTHLVDDLGDPSGFHRTSLAFTTFSITSLAPIAATSPAEFAVSDTGSHGQIPRPAGG